MGAGRRIDQSDVRPRLHPLTRTPDGMPPDRRLPDAFGGVAHRRESDASNVSRADHSARLAAELFMAIVARWSAVASVCRLVLRQQMAATK